MSFVFMGYRGRRIAGSLFVGLQEEWHGVHAIYDFGIGYVSCQSCLGYSEQRHLHSYSTLSEPHLSVRISARSIGKELRAP